VLPLSGLKQTVDYDQGFVTTKLGCLGIKFGFTKTGVPFEDSFEMLKRITEKR
jgi:ribosomal protein S3